MEIFQPYLDTDLSNLVYSWGGGEVRSPQLPASPRLGFSVLKAEQCVLSSVREQMNYSLDIFIF